VVFVKRCRKLLKLGKHAQNLQVETGVLPWSGGGVTSPD